MIEIYNTGAYLVNGAEIIRDDGDAAARLKQLGVTVTKDEARKGTVSHGILAAHNSGDEKNLQLKFDSLTSHDITYVGIIQTARASGMDKFPVPYVSASWCRNRPRRAHDRPILFSLMPGVPRPWARVLRPPPVRSCRVL